MRIYRIAVVKESITKEQTVKLSHRSGFTYDSMFPMQDVNPPKYDPAHAQIGDLQNKIFTMLGDEGKLSKNDREWLIRIYNSYQSGNRMSQKMAYVVLKIWKTFVENSAQKTASRQNWYKIAVGDSEFRDLKDSVRDLKNELKDLKNDVKPIKKDWEKFEKKVNDMEKVLKDLNVGARQYSQDRGVFNSLQRKIERFERVEQEWKNYKKDMDDKVKKQVEEHTKARIGDIAPQAY